jgi:hypothetical protein
MQVGGNGMIPFFQRLVVGDASPENLHVRNGHDVRSTMRRQVPERKDQGANDQ